MLLPSKKGNAAFFGSLGYFCKRSLSSSALVQLVIIIGVVKMKKNCLLFFLLLFVFGSFDIKAVLGMIVDCRNIARTLYFGETKVTGSGQAIDHGYYKEGRLIQREASQITHIIGTSNHHIWVNLDDPTHPNDIYHRACTLFDTARCLGIENHHILKIFDIADDAHHRVDDFSAAFAVAESEIVCLKNFVAIFIAHNGIPLDDRVPQSFRDRVGTIRRISRIR